MIVAMLAASYLCIGNLRLGSELHLRSAQFKCTCYAGGDEKKGAFDIPQHACLERSHLTSVLSDAVDRYFCPIGAHKFGIYSVRPSIEVP